MVEQKPTLHVPSGQQLVGGEWEYSLDQRELDVVDPATHEVIQTVARTGPADIDRAVRAARRAIPAWSAMSPSERGALLGRWAELINQNFERLAAIEAQDVGKPLSGGRRNVGYAAATVQYFAGAADKLVGATLPTHSPDFLGLTLREPWGVCAVVIPWNVPSILAMFTVAPALAAGNVVVLKASEIAPLAPLELAELARQAGLPPGVLNVVIGYGQESGTALTSHPDINHITFVGSPATGRAVMAAAAKNLVPVSLELGGKSPNVVFADANLDEAIPAIVSCITENAGQNCYAGSRLVVEKSIESEVVERVAEGMASRRLGSWDLDLDMGPMSSEGQRQRVNEAIQAAKADGARVVTGGTLGDEWFVTPTVFDKVDPSMRIVQEEVFGPVLVVQSFEGVTEAIDMMNGTKFGLLACIWTSDVSRGFRVAKGVRSGQVSVNEFHTTGVIGFPFNVQGESGFNKGSGYNHLLEYTQEKAVAIRLLS